MASLMEAIEVAYRQVFPSSSDAAVTLDEFIVSGKLEFAVQTWLMSKAEKREEGFFDVPSYSMTEVEKEVKHNSIDISDLRPMRALSNDAWLINIGGLECACRYVKSTLNRSLLMQGDDSLSDTDKTFFVSGHKILFPRGTHKDKLPIIYAHDGSLLDGDMEVSDVLASIVRDKLVEKYLGKINKPDLTENQNSSV